MDEYIPKTELEKIVMEYYEDGDNNFNWYQLSTSSSITIEFILHHLNYPWRWSLISQHIYIPEYVFEKYPLIIDKINWRNFTINPSFKLKYLYNSPQRKWSWYVLSTMKDISIDFIMKYHEKDWIFHKIYERNDIDFNSAIQRNPDYKWDWKKLSSNRNISIETIHLFQDHRWDWMILTNIYKDKLEVINQYPDLKWDWHLISESRVLNIDIIMRFHYKNWNWFYLSNKKILTCDFIYEYPKKSYDWDSLDIDYTIESVKKLKHLQMNWFRASSSKFITMDDIVRYIHFPWSWKGICENPNLTVEFMKKYESDLFNFSTICANTFGDKHLPFQFSYEHMEIAHNNVGKFKEELIRVAWHPERVMNWCFSIDDLE